jgi:hypothetical protein
LDFKKKIVKITSIFDNFRIFGVDSTHNELRDQLTSAQRNIVSAISWRPVLVVEEAEVPRENHQPWENNW